jgi:hypothetical protein
MLAAGLLFAAGLQAQETVQAVPANDFLQSIGVNTSIAVRGEVFTTTKACAAYLGVRWFRSSPPDGSSMRVAHYKDLYNNAGIRFSFAINGKGDRHAGNNYLGGIPFIIAQSKAVIAEIGTTDALIALEGCNEPNNWGILYQGEYGAGKYDTSHPGPYSWKPMARYQRDFYAAVKADPVLKDIPVWSASDMGAAWENVGLHFLTIPEGAEGVDPEFPAGTSYADKACIHNYFGSTTIYNNHTWRMASPTDNVQNGLYQHHGLTWRGKYVGYTAEQLETLPRVSTETGTTINTGFTEEYQALMSLSCYLSQFKRGFSHTAMYILRDRSDESGNQTYGFYQTDYTPRRSAHYLHNLTTILNDNTSTGSLKQLTYSVSPVRPSTVHELLLQKSNGTLMLVVWGERYATGSQPDNITIQFGQTFKTIHVYNPAQYKSDDTSIGTRPVATYANANAVPIAVLNHPFILELIPESTSIHPIATPKPATAIFPNPFRGSLNVESTEGIRHVSIADLNGQTLYRTSDPEEGKLHLSHLNRGVYLVRITTKNNTVETHKAVKL